MSDTTETKPKKSRWGILAWLAAAVMLIWAMAIGNDHATPAAMLVIAAILTLPPVQRRARAGLKPPTPKWFVAVIPVVLAVGGIWLGSIPTVADVEAAKDPVANVVAYRAAYQGATHSCNAGFQAISDEAQSASPDRQRMYDLAASTQGQCRAAYAAIQKIERPKGITNAEDDRFVAAGRSCDFAYMLAEQAAGKLKTALDGGMQPSQVAAFREKANEAAGYRGSCDTQLAEAAELAVAAHRNATLAR